MTKLALSLAQLSTDQFVPQEKSKDEIQPDFRQFCPRLPDEPSDAYEALFRWARLGRSRTIGRLSRQLQRDWIHDEVPTVVQLDCWHQQWAWGERVGRYDRECQAIEDAMRLEAWEESVRGVESDLIRVCKSLLGKASQIAQLPVVDQKVSLDGKTTVIKAKAGLRDAVAVVSTVREILEELRPRTQVEQVASIMGLSEQAIGAGLLTPESAETIMRHMAALKAELEGGGREF